MYFDALYMLSLEVLYSTLSCVLPFIYHFKRMHVHVHVHYVILPE